METSLVTVPEITPQERLALSRKAIVRHMQRHDQSKQRHDGEGHEYDGTQEPVSSGDGKWGAFKRALRNWWHHHPANVALDFARPIVGQYAREHPLKVLGISAGLGALAIIIKPWRLISLGGVFVATMKSSDIAGIVLSMLTAAPQHTNDPQGNE